MNIISIVFKKEIKDMFRDKKTLIASVLIPLLMYPIMFGFIGKGMNNITKSVKQSMSISIVDKDNSNLGKLIKSKKNIKIKSSNNMYNDVRDGKILLGIEIPQNFEKDISNEKTSPITFIIDNTSQKSNLAMNEVNKIINDYSKNIVSNRLKKRNLNPTILTPVKTVVKSAEKQKNGIAKMLLSLFLPMMLIMFSASGPIASATDLGAGEKERGTLEPLLTTQASRMSLLWGKFLAITTMGVVTSIAFMTSIFISMKTSPEAFGYGMDNMNFSMAPKLFLIVAIITVLLTMVFGALALAISIYARSFKEAQTYLTPLSFVGMLGFTSYFIDPKNMSTLFLNIPIVNATAVIKELILGIFNLKHLTIVFLWMIIYIVLSLLFARYMFNKENVIFRT